MIQTLDAPASSLSLSQTSSYIWFGDRNPALLCIDIADCWLGKEYSVRLIITNLEQVVTHWNAILFQLVYLQISLFISIYQTAVGIISPAEFANEAFHLQHVMEKSWTHRSANNYLYLFVWVNLCILFILDFKASFSNGAETELKCKKGIRENTLLAFFIYRQLVLSSF
jgi:hypothetical protein